MLLNRSERKEALKVLRGLHRAAKNISDYAQRMMWRCRDRGQFPAPSYIYPNLPNVNRYAMELRVLKAKFKDNRRAF